MTTRNIVRQEDRLDLSTNAGTVDAIVATYGGAETLYVQVHDTAPKATITFTDVGVATDVVVVGSQTYTWIATLSTDPSVANEILIGADGAASAAALLSALSADDNAGDSDVLWGAGTVSNPEVSARAGQADRLDSKEYTGEQITVTAKASTGAVPTTEDGANTSWDVATLPRLTAADVPAQTTAISVRTSPIVTEAVECAQGAVIVFSSTENTYTAAGTTDSDRTVFDVVFTVEEAPEPLFATDADIVFDFKFDGDLRDEAGGSPLVKSGGTDLFIPSPIPGRALAYRASVEHCEHAANEETLEITGALTLHTYVRRTASTDSVFLTFGNGDSAAAANNHLFTVAIADTTGALTFSQENAGGTNSGDTALPVLTSGEWVQVTYTRPTAATSVKLYLNGVLADTSGAITAPTGGTAGVLTVGGTEGSVDAPMDFASLTIFDTELTAAQVLAHCNRERGI